MSAVEKFLKEVIVIAANTAASAVYLKTTPAEAAQLAAELRAMQAEREWPRCPDCNGELSDCGPMTEDGPSADCKVCQLRSLLAAANRRADEWNELYEAAVSNNMDVVLGDLTQMKAERDRLRAEVERLRSAEKASDSP